MRKRLYPIHENQTKKFHTAIASATWMEYEEAANLMEPTRKWPKLSRTNHLKPVPDACKSEA